MRQGRQRAPLRGTLLLLLILWAHPCILLAQELDVIDRGDRKFGDKCSQTSDCGFEGSVCDNETRICLCNPELPVTDNVDKCGKRVPVGEQCFFDKQCEEAIAASECREGICSCQFGKQVVTKPDGQVECAYVRTGDKKFGDKCSETSECGFEGSICEEGKKTCSCIPELPITNHLDKCGKRAGINESCFFNEQCETISKQIECREGICACRFKQQAVVKPDGQVECIDIVKDYSPGRYIDPAMIAILVAMVLMFITICVVLRLFSKARWRENRTIFNTPNPRLMNVSLLKEHKDHKHPHERRGSRSSRGPSRQPSMASLRPHSPNSQEGSRRGSRGSSNASATSTRSNKSPPQASNLNSAGTPMLESVTVEIQEPKP